MSQEPNALAKAMNCLLHHTSVKKKDVGKSKRLKVKKSLIHGIASCENCDWSWEDYLTIHNHIRKHVHETGHKVKAEFGYFVEYSK